MYNQYSPWGMNMGSVNFTPKHRFNWNNILNNTQKTLGIINQAIPLIYQMGPVIKNARTLFKIAGAINEKEEYSTPPPPIEEQKNTDSNLQFFL